MSRRSKQLDTQIAILEKEVTVEKLIQKLNKLKKINQRHLHTGSIIFNRKRGLVTPQLTTNTSSNSESDSEDTSRNTIYSISNGKQRHNFSEIPEAEVNNQQPTDIENIGLSQGNLETELEDIILQTPLEQLHKELEDLVKFSDNQSSSQI